MISWTTCYLNYCLNGLTLLTYTEIKIVYYLVKQVKTDTFKVGQMKNGFINC